MSAFNTVTCPSCRKRFTWTGELQDRPPCPSCQHRPDPAELARVEQRLEKLRKRLLEEDTGPDS